MSDDHATEDNDICVNVLHASSLKAMSAFVQQPSAELAETVVRLLGALARHPGRFQAPCGYDVYAHVLTMWRELATHMRDCAATRAASTLH